MTYRIVIIKNISRVRDYSSYGGVEWFGENIQVGNDLVGEYDINGPADSTLLPDYGGTWPIPKPKTYRTLVTADEFIGLFTNGQWGDCVKTTDVPAADFVIQLQNYKKPFDTTNQRVTDGMTAIVQAQDISMTGAQAQEIVKGVPLWI